MPENLGWNGFGNKVEVALLQRGFETLDLPPKVGFFISRELTRRNALPAAKNEEKRQEKSLYDTRLSSVL
ncbi:hypothetical protein QE369_003559 [Agrobacterium larrymoorei]|uniref:Uncharacterized protein n=1 Tax=Agrobacterium larrymoorei TaxID=160699 RepID=A0AAJ2EW98_9HYPH|nr:hypothetical protein [Agrobacterium larrymoorei]MDR6103362.1 hypothetical protein [Agrobacterium larrymoorei]